MPTPTTTIDALPPASTPLGFSDLLVVQQSGVTRKVTASDLASAGVSPYSDEQAVDAVAAALASGPGINVAYNDGTNTITIGTTGLVANAGGAASLWAGSQAAYDALGTWSPTTVYVII